MELSDLCAAPRQRALPFRSRDDDVMTTDLGNSQKHLIHRRTGLNLSVSFVWSYWICSSVNL